MTGRIRLAGSEQGCCGRVLPAGISTPATFSVTFLPSPHPTSQSSSAHRECQLLCSMPRRRCGEPSTPAGMLPLFPPQFQQLRQEAGGWGRGRALVQSDLELCSPGGPGRMCSRREAGSPCVLPVSAAGGAGFSLEKALAGQRR